MGRASRKVRFEDELKELGLQDDDGEDGPKRQVGNQIRGILVGWYALVDACQVEAKKHQTDWIDLMRAFCNSTDVEGNNVVKADNDYGVLVLPEWSQLLKSQAKSRTK